MLWGHTPWSPTMHEIWLSHVQFIPFMSNGERVCAVYIDYTSGSVFIGRVIRSKYAVIIIPQENRGSLWLLLFHALHCSYTALSS